MVLICGVLILLIYTIDLFKLNYRIKGWEEFGRTPVTASHIQYFIADTPNLIGYQELDGGEMVSCATTVAYLKTDTNESYRCCDTSSKISCLAGDFSNDIPAFDAECTNSLREIFGIPTTLKDTTDYQMYGSCPKSGHTEITVVQISGDGQILWKVFNATRIAMLSSTAKCILAPLLLILAVWVVVVTVRKKEPIPRF